MFFQAINALQEPTPNWTNLRRNVSKMSEMSQKFNDSKVVGKVPQRSDASQNDHKSKGYPAKTSGVLPKVPKKVPNKGKPIESIGWFDV